MGAGSNHKSPIQNKNYKIGLSMLEGSIIFTLFTKNICAVTAVAKVDVLVYFEEGGIPAVSVVTPSQSTPPWIHTPSLPSHWQRITTIMTCPELIWSEWWSHHSLQLRDLDPKNIRKLSQRATPYCKSERLSLNLSKHGLQGTPMAQTLKK